MEALPDAAIDEALRVAERVPSPFTEVLIQPLGGAYSRVHPHATALGHRDAPWVYHALAPRDPSEPRLLGPPGPRALVLWRGDVPPARRRQGPVGPAQRVLPQPEHPAQRPLAPAAPTYVDLVLRGLRPG
jgi:hypothetical protein